MKIFLGKLELVNGVKKLKLNSPHFWQNELNKYSIGKELAIELDDRKATRSLSQNSYLWGIVYKTVSETTGFTSEEVHEWAKGNFIEKKLICIGNKEIYIASTKSLNKSEMTEYIEAIRSFSQNFLDCYIPVPEDKGYSQTEANLL